MALECAKWRWLSGLFSWVRRSSDAVFGLSEEGLLDSEVTLMLSGGRVTGEADRAGRFAVVRLSELG